LNQGCCYKTSIAKAYVINKDCNHVKRA